MNKKELAEIAKQLMNLNEEMKALEKMASERKEILKAAGSGQYGDFIVTVEERSRENFALKEAKTNLTQAVWNKISKFVKNTEYKQVKVVKA